MAFTFNDLYDGSYFENHQIQIISDRWTVKGYLTDEVQFDGRAYFREESDPRYQQWLNNLISAATGWYNSTMGMLGGGNKATMVSRQVKAAATTMVNWQGSDQFRLNLDMVFIATTSNDDVRVPVRALSEAVFPTFGSTGGIAESAWESVTSDEQMTITEAAKRAADASYEKNTFVTVLNAPLGYERGNYETPKGVMRVIIGKWFKSSSIFVCEDSSFRFSKEVMPNGRPLYATGNVQLTTCRPISSTEIKAWLSSNASVSERFVTHGQGYEYPQWGDVINAQSRAALPDMSDGNNRKFYMTPQPMEGARL